MAASVRVLASSDSPEQFTATHATRAGLTVAAVPS
jgi:hypothetical protein